MGLCMRVCDQWLQSDLSILLGYAVIHTQLDYYCSLTAARQLSLAGFEQQPSKLNSAAMATEFITAG